MRQRRFFFELLGSLGRSTDPKVDPKVGPNPRDTRPFHSPCRVHPDAPQTIWLGSNLLEMIIYPPKKMFQTTNQQHLPKCPNSVFGSFWGFMLGRSNSAGGFTCYPRQNSPVMSRPHLADKSPLRLHRLTHHLGKLHNFAFLLSPWNCS